MGQHGQKASKGEPSTEHSPHFSDEEYSFRSLDVMKEEEEDHDEIDGKDSDSAEEISQLKPKSEDEENFQKVSSAEVEGTDKKSRFSEEDETAEEYRLRVYGMIDKQTQNQDDSTNEPGIASNPRQLSSSFRHSLNRSLRRQSEILKESVPETPAGWIALLSAIGSAILGYEIRLQQSLTAPPLVFGQCGDGNSSGDRPLDKIYQHMAATPQSILRRDIQPSLFVGTRGLVASSAAFLTGGPSQSKKHLRFREIMYMTQDGAQIGMDWELPSITDNDLISDDERRENILKGPIRTPVVLILHGLNNDASFGYVKSLMRACCERGWVAAGMNFRGCGGVPLTTPRCYNGAYTGDIRCVIQQIVPRLEGPNAYLFLVGNSLGANLAAKYLGEEGLSGTLSPKVAGAVTLGNPMAFNAAKIDSRVSPLMALGTKKIFLDHWSTIRQMKDKTFQSQMFQALRAFTMEALDEALAPNFARNDPFYPFNFRIGYKNGPSYWTDASSFRFIRHISVPTLQIMAADDMLCFNPFKNTFAYSLANPNVMIVETRCGGHLGWQESPPQHSILTGNTSWADVATTDFIEAVLQTKMVQKNEATELPDRSKQGQASQSLDTSPSHLRSRL